VQFVDVDVPADIVVVAFAENLLIDPEPVRSLVQVVDLRWAAPAHMKRQLDSAVGLL
jgi:hypothetical protein